MRETWVQSLGWEDLLEKEMATRSSILAWKIPWMEEPGRLQFMGSQRVGHNWMTSLTHSLTHSNMNLMWSPGPYSPSTTFSSYIQSSTYHSLVSATITLKSRFCGYPTSTSNFMWLKTELILFSLSADDSSYRFYFHDKSIIHSLKLKPKSFSASAPSLFMSNDSSLSRTSQK